MIARFARIRREFGLGAFVSLLILIAGLAYMCLSGLFHLSSPIPLGITLGGFLGGYLLRDQFGALASSLDRVTTTAQVVYAVVFVSVLVWGSDYLIQLTIITIATVLVFSLRFWTLSHPNVFRVE